MIVVRDPADFPAQLRPSAITIGKFDGLHRGHAALIDELHAQAESRGLSTVVVTFDRHPAAVFAPERAPYPIVSLGQKIDLLADHAVDATVVLEFNEELSQRSALEFVRDILVAQLGVQLLIVGSDFRFGHRGSGDVDFLREHAEEFGYDVIVPVDALGEDGRRASSTWLREALDAGDVGTVSELLGRDHSLTGVVGHGAKRGRELGFPTANLDADSVEGFIPGDGVYAGWFTVDGEQYPAAISVGNNPTFDGVPQRQVEAHLIGVALDLYDKRVEVSFVKRIRGMEKFSSIDELVERIACDVKEAAAALR